jgi:zinc transport system substrate-binding protein
VFDVAPAAHLDLTVSTTVGSGATPGQAPTQDPHFWLDPTRLADVGDALAERLGALDPARAASFVAGAAALRADLTALDAELRTGLSDCASRDLVTSHTAFGYLGRRYGLTQVGITGLSAEAEPDAGTIAKVADFVRAHGVRTIYYETLVSPDVARTVAAETGAATAVLDPIEGLTAASAASDYLGIMRADLAALRKGQSCA